MTQPSVSASGAAPEAHSGAPATVAHGAQGALAHAAQGAVAHGALGALAWPRGVLAIDSYHAHIYWADAAERALALELRERLAERFAVALGRVHEQPIGPHTRAMYQVAFTTDVFPKLAPWLMLNRRGLSVLIHPNTGHELADHLTHALWLGPVLAVRGEVLSNEPGPNAVSAPIVNTEPRLSCD